MLLYTHLQIRQVDRNRIVVVCCASGQEIANVFCERLLSRFKVVRNHVAVAGVDGDRAVTCPPKSLPAIIRVLQF